MSRIDLKEILTRSRRAASEDPSGSPSASFSIDDLVQSYTACVGEESKSKGLFLSRVSSRDNMAGVNFLEQLLVFLRTRRVEQPHLLWRAAADSVPRNHLHYKVLYSLITTHFSFLGPFFRREAFRFVTHESSGVDDMSEKLRVLTVLTSNGRDLSPFETDMGDVCTGWLANHFDKLTSEDVRELLGLICRAVAYVPSFLSTENKTLLLQRACVVTTGLRAATQVPVVEACLGFLEAVVQHGLVLPPNCLSPMVASICCTVNVEKLCDVSWRIGRGLLSSLAHSVETLDALCAILQSQGMRGGGGPSVHHRGVQNVGSIIRGAVFFVAMSCWGKDKIESLRAAPVNILAAFVHAARSGYSVAAYEVLLSVRRLIRKQGAELVVEWDNIFLILHELAAYTSSNASFVRVLIDTLNSLRALSDTNRFAADPQRLLWLLEAHASVLPARDSLRLLRTRLNQPPPLVTNEQIDQCLRKHLLDDKRTDVKTSALAEVMDWLTHGSTLVDETRAVFVLPVWKQLIESLLNKPSGQERGSLMALVQNVARNVAEAAIGARKTFFFSCVNVLSETIASSGSRTNPVLGQVFDDAATEGLAMIFTAELAASRGRRARYVFDSIVVLLNHSTVSVRQRVMHYLSSLRADGRFEVLLTTGQSSNVRVSASMQGSKSELNLSLAVDLLVKQARVESSRPNLLAIYVTIQDWLWNKFVLRGVVLDGLASLICSELKEGKLPEPFRGNSHEGLELVKTMLQVALLLVAYNDQFSQPWGFVLELGRTFHHLLRFPFAGGVFDPTGRASLQRLCLQGLCSVAAHTPSNMSPLPIAAVDAVCSLASTPSLDDLVIQTLNFLARVPALMAGLSKTQISAVLESLVLIKNKRSFLSRYYCYKTAVTWLTCLPAADRPNFYSRILPHLMTDLGGPDSIVIESVLDWMANVVFLELAPDRNAGVAPHERFGFSGRPSTLVLQGNCVMEIVTGMHGWSLVVVRRASGRVSWITRLVNDFSVISPPTLNAQVVVPESMNLHSYSTLFRPAAPVPKLEPPIVPAGSGVLGAPLLSSGLLHDNAGSAAGVASPNVVIDPSGRHILSPDTKIASRRGTLTSPANASVARTSAVGVLSPSASDLPPLNPKGALEKKLPKPELRYFAMESPRDLTTATAAAAGNEDEGSADDETTDLRMAALFSYNEGDDLEEERDTFFAAHSLNGSRAPSTGSSASVSPPRNHRKDMAATVTAPAPSSNVVILDRASAGVAAAGLDGKSVSMDDGIIKRPANSRSPSRGRTMSDSKLETPLLLTYPLSNPINSPEPRSPVSTLVGAPPHASLLFMQMRYIPFSDDAPFRLPSGNAALSRALSVLDYMPARGSHKIGLLFVAKGQRTESEIFSNQRGSVAYHQFVRNLGDTVRLRGYRGYAGGLDTTSDTDGEFSVRFRDETVDLMVHVATMMPPGNVLAKKRHVGNDNVLLIWDESNEYDPKIVQSEFNLVSILITPVGPVARVSVFRKREMVHFSPVSLNQLVRLDALPALVLHTALNADRVVSSLLSSDDPLPNLALRLKQIKKIRLMAEQQQPAQGASHAK